MSEEDVVQCTPLALMAQVPPYLSSARTGMRLKAGLKRTAFFPVIGPIAQSFRMHNTYLKPWIVTDADVEYRAIREHAGLLDVTGEEVVEVVGADALECMNSLVVRDVARMQDGTCRYAVMCYDYGGIVEDAVLARFSKERFWWVGGPAAAEQWIYTNSLGFDVEIHSYLDELHVASIQGPASRTILQRVCEADLSAVPYYGLVPSTTVCGVTTTITRTGFTGELGYDLYVGVGDAERLFRGLLDAGRADGITLCGSCALDRRRVEAAILNVGQDFDWATDPFEIGLEWMIDAGKRDFHGRSALEALSKAAPKRRLVGLRAAADQPLVQTSEVYLAGEPVGRVTSSAASSTLNAWLGLAMVRSTAAALGTKVHVGTGDEAVAAEVVATPFLDPRRELSRA